MRARDGLLVREPLERLGAAPGGAVLRGVVVVGLACLEAARAVVGEGDGASDSGWCVLVWLVRVCAGGFEAGF